MLAAPLDPAFTPLLSAPLHPSTMPPLLSAPLHPPLSAPCAPLHGRCLQTPRQLTDQVPTTSGANNQNFPLLGLNAITQVTLTVPVSHVLCHHPMCSASIPCAVSSSHAPSCHPIRPYLPTAADWLITSGSGQDLHPVTTIDELM
ncbi:unnamed protein product [Closterium sp. Yama58-4]|nr:unnamed protein product [Closterium sp. Yama58-4]